MQNIDLKALKKCIAKKEQNIQQLQNEYNSLKTSENLEPNNMKSSFLMLKAEIDVLSSSVPMSVPNFQPLLFAYVHHSVRKEVNNLEELILFQKQILKISLKKSQELKQLCEREQIDYESTEASSHQEMSLEKERTRSKMLEFLHRKLVYNIRRITKQFYPAVHVKEEKITKCIVTKEKSMLYILKNLLTELSHNSGKSNEWEKSNCLRIDESFPKNYIQLLLDNQIVKLQKDSFSLKLVLK